MQYSMYLVVDWLTDDVIREFWTEEARDAWMNDHCEWYSDGCYLADTSTKVYCCRS